jgi:hypothetical protein
MIKAAQRGYIDTLPLDEAQKSDDINIGGILVCGLSLFWHRVAYILISDNAMFRDYRAGQENLERTKQGRMLATHPIELANEGTRIRPIFRIVLIERLLDTEFFRPNAARYSQKTSRHLSCVEWRTARGRPSEP